jgi:hypothetical protein
MANVWVFDELFNGLGRGRFAFQSDSFKIALTNVAPVKGTSIVLADITQIAAGNGYTTGGSAITLPWAETGAGTGIWQLGDANSDCTFTATGGSIAQFRYAVLYAEKTVDSVTNPLISVLDYGGPVDLTIGNPFEINAGANGWLRFTTPTWA